MYQAVKGWYDNSAGMAPDGTWYGLCNGKRVVLKGEKAQAAWKQAQLVEPVEDPIEDTQG